MKRLIRGGTLVTVSPTFEILTADLLVDGDRIAAIGDLSDLQADEVIEAAGRVVIPGLIQTHIHLCQTLFRGQADDLELLDTGWGSGSSPWRPPTTRSRSTSPRCWGSASCSGAAPPPW